MELSLIIDKLLIVSVPKLDKTKAQQVIDKFSKIQRIRHESLEILLEVDKKASDYKLDKLKKRFEDLTK